MVVFFPSTWRTAVRALINTDEKVPLLGDTTVEALDSCDRGRIDATAVIWQRKQRTARKSAFPDPAPSIPDRAQDDALGWPHAGPTPASLVRMRIVNRTPGGYEDMAARPIGRHRVAVAGVWD